MSRTNIVLDDALVAKTLKLTGLKTRRELVDFALRELLRHADQMKILQLKGAIDWRGDLTKSRKTRDFE